MNKFEGSDAYKITDITFVKYVQLNLEYIFTLLVISRSVYHTGKVFYLYVSNTLKAKCIQQPVWGTHSQAKENISDIIFLKEDNKQFIFFTFQITNLKRIRTDPNYQELRELHAENNQIVSMHEIEASNFIKNFQVLDIRANRLTEVRFKLYQVLKLHCYDNYTFLDCVSQTTFLIL